MSIITFSDRLSKFLMVAAAAWAFGLAFLIMADIVGRTVFSKPIYGTAEMVAASSSLSLFLAGRLRHSLALHAQGGFPG